MCFAWLLTCLGWFHVGGLLELWLRFVRSMGLAELCDVFRLASDFVLDGSRGVLLGVGLGLRGSGCVNGSHPSHGYARP